MFLEKSMYSKEEIREIIICNKKFEIDIMKDSISHLKNSNLLDEKFEVEDKNLLLLSLIFKNTDIAKILIDCGANAEISDFNKMTPLMWACYFNLSEIVELLIQNGVNTNSKTRLYCWTALMHASYANSIESVKILLKNGVDINLVDNEGKKAIDIAIREEHEEIVKLINFYNK